MTIDELRAEINAIDIQMAGLFARRMELASRVALEKRRGGEPVLQSGREEAILARLDRVIAPPWRPALHQLYATIFELSRARQHAMLREEG